MSRRSLPPNPPPTRRRRLTREAQVTESDRGAMDRKITFACVTVDQGNCLDAVETGRVRVSPQPRGELVVRIPLGRDRLLTKDATCLEMESPRCEDLAGQADSRAPSKEARTEWLEVRMRGRTVTLDPAGRVRAWRLPAGARGRASRIQARTIRLHRRQILVLATVPTGESEWEEDAPFSIDDFDHLSRGLVPQQVARQLASLVLGRRPDAIVTLLVLMAPGTLPVWPAFAAAAMTAAGVLLLAPHLPTRWGDAPDAGFAVLLSGEAAPIAEDGQAWDPVRRLDVIPPGNRTRVLLPAAFGFASHEDESGLGSFRLYASQGTRLGFVELDVRARNLTGPLRPMRIYLADGELLLLRSSPGRQACIEQGAMRLCTSSPEGFLALGAACTPSKCTWSCLAGPCLLSAQNQEVTMPAGSILPPNAEAPVALSAAQASFWSGLCGGCLAPD